MSPAALTDPCELWTVDEVSAAMGGGEFTIEPASSGAPICGFVGTKFAGDLIESIHAGFAFGDESTGSLLDLMRQNFPDADELDIGGVTAIPGTTYPGAGAAEGWSTSSLYLFPDPMIMVELGATAPEGVDGAATLVALATLAAPRIATIQPPATSPSPSAAAGASVPPASSGEQRTGLAARFPTDIGGKPTSIDVELTGPEFLSQIVNFKPMVQKVTRALRKRDTKVGDLSFVSGGTGAGSLIAAFQVDGAQIKPFVNVLLASLDMQRTGQAVRQQDVAGKNAFAVTGGFFVGSSGVAYAKDDVLWLVFSFDPEQVRDLREPALTPRVHWRSSPRSGHRRRH